MNWMRPSLSEITTLGPQYGANVRAKPPSGGPVRYVRITDIDDRGRLREDSRVEPDSLDVGDYFLEDGDLLLARSGATVGKSYLYSAEDGPCIFAGYLIRFRPDRRVVEPKYLAYYFQTPEYWTWVGTKKRVAAQPNVNGVEYASLTMPVASPSEQRRIVEILDDGESLRRLRLEADQRAERVLHTVMREILGPPAEWPANPTARPLGDLIIPVSGGTPSKREDRYWVGEMPWVSPKDMKRDFLWGAEDHISTAATDDTNLKIVEPGAVLIVVRGMILARALPLSLTRRRVTINQDMKALLPASETISGEYIWAALKLVAGRLLGLVRTAGHGTRKLDTPDLLGVSIPVPSPQQLALVTTIVQTHEGLTDRRRESGERINRLFSLLLSQAFTGQLTASWRQSHMAEIVEEMRAQADYLEGSRRC